MRKRNVNIQVWLNRKEAEELDKKVKRSGLSREVYLRHLINSTVPQEQPQQVFHDMVRQLHGIGNNLNQIAVKAHTLNVIDVQQYDKECAKLENALKEIIEAVMLPRPIEK